MQSSKPATCTRCHADLSNPLVCSACLTLHSPSALNCFELFGLPQQYQLDLNKLTSAFRSIARQIHPDRFAGASDETRILATQLSARVNESYSVLKDPVSRANYMLELVGGPSAIELREVPGSLLMEVMELRERMEEANTGGNQEALDSIRASVLEQKEQALSEIAAKADSLATADEAGRRDFRKLLNSMRYFENLLDELAVDPLATAARPT